jgi:hypothetical protein
MRLQPKTRRRAVRAVQCVATFFGLCFWWNYLPPPPDPWILNLTNNPDRFFMRGGPGHFRYNFTYDPHAADEWRFEHYVFLASQLSATNSDK